MARASDIKKQAAKVIVAAARRLDSDKTEGEKKKSEATLKATKNQLNSWAYFKAIGEVKQAGYFLANTMSLVRLYIAERVEDDQEPAPPPEGTAGLFEARDALDRLRSDAGGHGWLLQGGTLNLVAAGEFELVGYPEQEEKRDPATDKVLQEATPEQWKVHSVSELEVKDGKTFVRAGPGAKPKELPEDAFTLRVWQPDGEFGELADCALMGCLAEAEELLLIARMTRGAIRNRIAGAGVWYVPTELSFGSEADEAEGDDTGDGEQTDPLSAALMTAMTAPLADEGEASSVVPMVVRGPAEFADKLPHITFDRPLDASWNDKAERILKRLMSSLDIPVEQVMGMANVNHWTAWQVDQATWTRYGTPKAVLICEALTAGFLHPMLLAAGLAEDVVRRLIVWFDPAGAIADADRSDVAFKAHDRLLISDDTARDELGYSDADAPDDEEVQRRIAQGLPSGFADSIEGPPNNGDTPDGPTRRLLKRLLRRQPVTAAARRPKPLGERLVAIDRELRLRLEADAHAAMFRALERAGARVRNRAVKRADMRAAVAHCTASRVVAQLADRLGELNLTEDDLLAGGFDGLEQRFTTQVARAQERTRRLMAAELDLSDSELDELEQRQEQDRSAAWVWLAGAMLALGRQRLYNPQPGAQPGEFDATTTVPPGLMREALARAGGAASGAAQQTPPGGVATGQLVQDLWRQHGRVVAGWSWVYGDPASRTTAFPGHEKLDGIEFATWQDEQLLVDDEDSWLGVTHYRPGDHDWCQCDFAPVMLSEGDIPEDRTSEMMDQLEPV